jgi:hypothetical protein
MKSCLKNCHIKNIQAYEPRAAICAMFIAQHILHVSAKKAVAEGKEK